jgi:hypothetical protein
VRVGRLLLVRRTLDTPSGTPNFVIVAGPMHPKKANVFLIG